MLSAVSSFNWQNLDNRFFYGAGSSAIYFAYIGLKLSWDLPTNVQKISNLKNREIRLKVAENNLALAEEQETYARFQQETELKKARSQLESLEKIEALKQDTFEKNYAQFEENILSLDKLLISQNDWLTGRLNRAAGAVNVRYNYQILKINNRY
ncbi:MAG: TolC family protein [Leadbetterella sp.]|nr:TolC family protein [Leadbetterella sp.]